MSVLSVTNTFVTGTKIFASQVNSNYSDIVNYVNNRNSGSTAWDGLNVSGAASLTGSMTISANLTVGGNSSCSTVFLGAVGSSSAPAYSFTSATSSGMYLSGSSAVTVAANGASGGYMALLPNGDFLTSQVAPVATNATAGFFFLPTVNGTPSGTPTTYTGQKAALFDTSANKLWIYNAGWKFVTLS